MIHPIYLDHNATTPMDPKVLEAMLPYFVEKFGNSGSNTHSYGWETQEAVDLARESVANLIHAKPKEIIFTSGATEAVNLAIKGFCEANSGKGDHVITVQTEHKAVLDTCAFLEKIGKRVTYLPVDEHGQIDLVRLEAAITPQTLLISAMYANNETGVIHPIAKISSIAKKHGIAFFSDATQAVGKIPIDVHLENVDFMAFSAHKMYGPKGVGALFINRKSKITLETQMHGGSQEQNLRSGTLNVPGIVGFGKAAELCEDALSSEFVRLQTLRNYFENELASLGITLNGHQGERLPHCSNISFPDIDGERFILEASGKLAFSQSSACSSATFQPSHVLKAMGLSDHEIRNSFRFSLGRFITKQDIDSAIHTITTLVKAHRSERN